MGSERRREKSARRLPSLPAIDAAAGARAALVLGAALVVLVVVRGLAVLEHGATWWGADALRYTAPWLGWALAALVPLAFLPPVARAIEARLAALGDALARVAFGAGLAFAAAGAALVLVFPDRLWMMGDFLIRLGCTRGRIPTEMVFPQALPLDLFLHQSIPVALAHAGLPDPSFWERTLGAIEALALGFAAAAFARRLGLRGAALVVTAGLVVFSGSLVMFTGYGKAFVELTLATVVTAGFALRVAQEGRGTWPLAIAVGLSLLFHRSALVLLVPHAVAFAVRWRTGGTRPSPAFLAAFALPFAVAAAASPWIIAAMKVTDARHLAPAGATAGAVLGAAFRPAHLREVLNLVLSAAPFALAAPFLALAMGSALRERRRELLVLGSLALPALALLMFVHPRQGVFRDVDVFAPSLTALTLIAAALAGDAVRGAGKRAWIAAPLMVFVVVTTVLRLSVAADLERGMARARDYLEGPPARDDEQRALLWSWMGERYLGERDFDRAAEALTEAAALAPSPRILLELAMTEMDRGNFRGAQEVYGRAAVRAPGFVMAWLGLADASIRARDWAAAEHAVQQAEVLAPGRADVVATRRALEQARPRPGATP